MYPHNNNYGSICAFPHTHLHLQHTNIIFKVYAQLAVVGRAKALLGRVLVIPLLPFIMYIDSQCNFLCKPLHGMYRLDH